MIIFNFNSNYGAYFMKALITGSHGTLGKVLTETLNSEHIETIGWNRSEIDPTDVVRGEHYVEEIRPDFIFHLATDSHPSGTDNEAWKINVEWSENLARWSHRMKIPMVYTGSVMVFTDNATGPFRIDSIPDATEGYGFFKRSAEEHILRANPKAVVARIGWQIGRDDGSNNMVAHLAERMRDGGLIHAGTKWLPACSFLEDTVPELIRLAREGSGLYQIDSNRKWNFYQIVRALDEMLNAGWEIIPTEDFIYDQRMIDDRVRIPALSSRLNLS